MADQMSGITIRGKLVSFTQKLGMIKIERSEVQMYENSWNIQNSDLWRSRRERLSPITISRAMKRHFGKTV